jgi:cytochrome c oxidase cbb3-type subunit 3
MCSRCRPAELALLLALLALAGCERERREFRDRELPADGSAAMAAHAGVAGGEPGALYERNAFHVSEGARYFSWFNCSGCHGAGGGGMGPALMDGAWRYGGSVAEIAASIRDGRPNGMPAYGGRIPEQQVWQLAAYVRALSGNVPLDATPSRRDGLSATPPLTLGPELPPARQDPSADLPPPEPRP